MSKHDRSNDEKEARNKLNGDKYRQRRCLKCGHRSSRRTRCVLCGGEMRGRKATA